MINSIEISHDYFVGMSVVYQINCMGGITCGPRACSVFFLAVKSVAPVLFITPYAQRERGKVIDRGVHIYIYVCGRKKYLNRTFRDRLTFSNIDSRTSR